MSSSRPRGFTLIEIIFVIALWAVIAGIAVPQVLVAVDRQKAWAAARYLAARMAMARSYAVTRSAYVALRFTPLGDDVMFQMFVDGNRNGVRTLDIGSRVDSAIGVSVRLSELFPGVVIGISTDVGTDPVRIGSTNLLSFGPLGTATPGTIYVRSHDGLQLALKITGATGRTRLLRYVPDTREWVGAQSAPSRYCQTSQGLVPTNNWISRASPWLVPSDAAWVGSTYQSCGSCDCGNALPAHA